MSGVTKRTISLPSEHAAFIDKKVASGAYVSASEVVRAGLRALQDQDAAFERWLREDVAPVYDATKAGSEKVHSAKSVFAEARARYAARRKSHR